MKNYAIILAAGKGTRMRTEMPKCAFPILKKPMIEYILENVDKSVIDEVTLVVGHKKEIFKEMLGDKVKYCNQDEQLGTGHAVKVCEEELKNKQGNTIILLGDMPLVDYKVMNLAFEQHEISGDDLTVITTDYDNPKGYGRIIRDENGNIERIVEHRDCTDEQKFIKEVNTGIYVVDNRILFEAVNQIKVNERKGEYYLTDIVEIIRKKGHVGAFRLWDSEKVMGINDLYTVSIAERFLRRKINQEHMLNGVYMVNPKTITVGHDVTIEPGVTIYPNTYITGGSVIKEGAKVGPNTEIHGSIIHNNVSVKHSLVFDSEIMENTVVGPFAHLRNGAKIGPNNRIGNFVEVKNSTTGFNTKAAHLAYIGDSETGRNVNFGCGSITVNYDGINKHRTIIGDDVFIGCNTNLVAPLEVGNNVFIAAGSTVTKNIPSGALAIARNRQINKADYAKNLIKPKNDN